MAITHAGAQCSATGAEPALEVSDTLLNRLSVHLGLAQLIAVPFRGVNDHVRQMQ